ncbi:glycosyltransferase [Clostridiaceae bacterium]|nr:glycosyltransferase [Clostridiaceae bacterium]RKI17423.1 glycosyltransferase [bacterium 1XD21-70]
MIFMSTYMFSFRYNRGNIGGSGGVNYKLMAANESLKLISGLTHFFREDTEGKINNKGIQHKLMFLRKFGSIDIVLKKYLLNKAIKWMENLDANNCFEPEDVYIFHDIEGAYAFFRVHPDYKKVMLVYHQQGSLYDEWSASFNVHSRCYKNYLNKLLLDIFSKCYAIGFPSKGARDVLIEHNKYVKELLDKKKSFVLYNGVDIPEILPMVKSEKVKEAINRIKNVEEPIFISVSNLNYAKGVDQIPKYLMHMRKKHQKFFWVIVGDGVMSESLCNEIAANKIEENVIWLKSKIPNTDILNLFKYGDYYIMLHRWSIFDLATLEAMGLGCIPILSNTGGNPEVIIENNGFLVDSEDYKSVAESVDNTLDLIPSLSLLNKKIQCDNFSVLSMLKRYKEMIESLDDLTI